MRIRESWKRYREDMVMKNASKPLFQEWDEAVRRKTPEEKRAELLKTAAEWAGRLAIVTRFAGYDRYEEKVKNAASGIASAMPTIDKIYVQNIETVNPYATSAEVEHLDIADALMNDYGKNAVEWGYFEPSYFDTFSYHPSLETIPKEYLDFLEQHNFYQPPQGSNLEVILNAARETTSDNVDRDIGLHIGYVAVPSALRLHIDGITAHKDEIRGGSVHVLSKVDEEAQQINWDRVVDSDWLQRID
jgi:hypothetical protein